MTDKPSTGRPSTGRPSTGSGQGRGGGIARAANAEDLAAVRRHVGELARRAGLDRDRVDRLVLAVNEVVANAVRHGVPPATVRVTTTGTAVLVSVHDRGTGGVLPPQPVLPAVDRPDGRGLWLATRMCDRVDVRTGPDGTTVMLATDL